MEQPKPNEKPLTEEERHELLEHFCRMRSNMRLQALFTRALAACRRDAEALSLVAPPPPEANTNTPNVRNPAVVIDAILAVTPFEQGALRMELVKIHDEACFRSPEGQWPTWHALKQVLEQHLNVPPQHDWEKHIAAVVEGRIPV